MKKLLLLTTVLMSASILLAQSSAHKDCMHSKIRSYKSKQNFVPHGLSDNYDLVYQRTFWEIDPSQHYIKGHVTSYFKSLSADLETVYFDLLDNMTLDSVKRGNETLTANHANDLIEINLPASLAINQLDSLTIYYKGAPSSAGFGSFETNTHNGTPVMWTLSEPYGARDWWPCKQTLTDKIDSIDIYVQTDPEYKVGSNGVLMSENVIDDKKVTFWKHRHPITTYLVAIAVTDYAEIVDYAMVDETHSVEILNYVYPEYESYYEDAVEYTVDVMELFSELFIPYPFWNEKYGHAQFGWGGGMEHQTMSFMGGFSHGLIAHELAHQWFGDFITCGSWQDIWVNEGFAVFCENITVENLHPEEWLDWKAGEMSYVLAYGTSGSVYVDDTTSVGRIFDGVLTYAKGGYVLYMLRNQIGDEAFYTGLQNYLTHSSFANAYALGDDVKYFLEEAADTNLNEFFNDWYYGQGYPDYDITWSQNESGEVKITINQSQTHASVDYFEMKVPIEFSGQGNSEIIEFHNTYDGQVFTFTPGYAVEDVVFDPDLKILAKHVNVISLGSDTVWDQVFSLSPNPAKDHIQFQLPTSLQVKNICIVDASGKTIQEVLDVEQRSLAINHLQKGIYFLKVETNQGLHTQRFVKN